LISAFTVISVLAQTTPTVTIKVNGNRNKEVRIDGQTYTVSTDVNAVNNANSVITITSLSPGQHTLEVVRTNRNNNTNIDNTTTFTLRPGYDLQIAVNGNGSVQTSETRTRRNNTGQTRYRNAVQDAEFNSLLQRVQSHFTTSGRTKELNTIFANTGYYFTSAQAKQLIEQVSSQPARLALVKTAYKSLTDPVNYRVLSDLLTTQSGRNDFENYVLTYNRDNPGFSNTNNNYNNNNNNNNNNNYNNNNSTGNMAMSEYNFSQLYSEAQNQGTTSARTAYLANLFGSNYNYFTTAQVRQLLQLAYSENDRLTLAKAAYDNVVDPANFSQLYDLFNYQSNRNDLANYVNRNGNTVNQPVAAANFSSIYQAARDKWPTTAKFTYLQSVFDNSFNYFTASQARQLIQLVYADNERLQLAKAAYDNITDPANISQLNDLFSSQSAREDFAAFLRNNGSSTGYTSVRTPVSDADFNALYRDIESRWGLGVKYAALTEVFNNTNNYFTTAQAKQLIQLVSAEGNRLQLAKSAYRNITDPENFSQIYDVLASQASRNELAAYVNSYSYNK
jgi:hypothetical protein